MFIRSWGAILSLRNLFSDAHLIGQLTNRIIDRILEIELGRGITLRCKAMAHASPETNHKGNAAQG